ncbi:pollen-specific leucine-rich repeat extensin-like protein 2 [Stylophora pistillata]|uniref:BEN domain-containing protein n=1 Tax=Stylophora pistillata TaxID=50429 RepID=A0A2B4RFB4_STYPI|nr:pollen-specific leucine-rich repeat extensin-like protein 2 [Stylophora pistillata]PFX15489.1 hypothetical protein AWC38_SpisGene20295 [Stylophora pistillata]
MSDSGDFRDQDEESETAVNTAKRRGRGRKRTPSKFSSKSKRSKQTNQESEDVLADENVPEQATPPYTVTQPPHKLSQLLQIVAANPSQPAPREAHLLPHPVHTNPQNLQTVPRQLEADLQPSNVVSEHLQRALGVPPPETPATKPQPPYAVPAVTQPQLPNTVPQAQNTFPAHPPVALQSPPTVPQPLQSGLQTPNIVPQHLQTGLQSSQTLPQQHPNTIPQPSPVVHQPPCTVPQHSQVAHPSPAYGPIEGVTPLPTFFQFTLPSSLYSSPVISSTPQNPRQQAVPSSLTAPHSSPMSLLSALQDDKLSLILPVLVRMEHKIDQIMVMIGAKSAAGVNGLQVGNQLNTALVGNQSSATASESQPTATVIDDQTRATSVPTQSNSRAQKSYQPSQSSFPRIRKHSNPATRVTQNRDATLKQPNAKTVNTTQSNNVSAATPLNTPLRSNLTHNTDTGSASHSTDIEAPSNNASVERHLTNTTVETEEKADLEMECQGSGLKLLQSEPSGVSKSLRGISARQRIQLEMAKITEQTLPEDLDFPISRDNLIALQVRSNSTMNFAVRLLRELFTPDELYGRNISGVRGKDQVDPTRVEMIKDILFKIYRTSPADKELLWRYCRKAMDSFLRKMHRPGHVSEKDKY